MFTFRKLMLFLPLLFFIAGVQAEDAPPARQGKELQTAVKDTLKKWNRSKPEVAEDAAQEFLVLFEELKQDTQIPEATKAPMQKNVRLKLASLSRQISERLEKEQKLTAKTEAPATVKMPEDKTPVAAQIGGGQGWNQGNTNRNYNTDRGRIGGEQLIDVIKITIRPDSWDDKGGNGTIMYWGPQGYLIITQTDEVHEQIGGVLKQMRQ